MLSPERGDPLTDNLPDEALMGEALMDEALMNEALQGWFDQPKSIDAYPSL